MYDLQARLRIHFENMIRLWQDRLAACSRRCRRDVITRLVAGPAAMTYYLSLPAQLRHVGGVRQVRCCDRRAKFPDSESIFGTYYMSGSDQS